MKISILTPESKKMCRIREKEEKSREVRTQGRRQHKITTGNSAAASSAPGKKELLMRCIHKLNLKDSIRESKNFSVCMKETTI